MKPLLKNVLLAAATGLLFCMACPVLAQPKPTEPDPQVKPPAHEALQETLLRVVRHARRFESEELFWSWFTVLARSAASDGGRKRHRHWQLLASYARSLMPRDVLPPAADGDERLQEFLNLSLGEFEPEARSLVEGKYLRRVSVQKLAVESSLTEYAVESRSLRARRELRALILKKLRHENIT